MPNGNEEEDYYDYGTSSGPERGTEEDQYINGAPFLTQDQASIRDAMLSQALPQGSSPAVAPAGVMGEASREYRTGRPGLFVQGGPTIPAGMLEVNGQLERSQAAPQPVPWWITQADEFKEQRRQEDLLTRLMQQSQAQGERQGGMAIERAQQLQARMNVANKVNQGMSLRDALASEPNIYGSRNTPSMTRLATSKPPSQPSKPFSPTVAEVGGKKLIQVSPNRYAIQQEGQGQVTPLAEFRANQSTIRQLRRDRLEALKIDEKGEASKIEAEIKDLETANKGLKTNQSSSPSQTQTSPRVALANQLASQNPGWSKQRIIDEVRKQLK